MTALDQYIRLEATGHWRENADEPWREVLVSFGNASLVLSDFHERALTHWALAAVVDVSEGPEIGRFSPAADSSEVLELRDADMIDAITQTTARARSTAQAPPKRRLLRPLVYLAILALLVAGFVQGPPFLKDRAFKMIPPERAALIGADLARGFENGACTYAPGHRSIAEIRQKIGVETASGPLVIEAETPYFARLPGGRPLFSAALIEAAPSPEALAGWLLLADEMRAEDTVLHALMRQKSVPRLLQFLFAGQLEAADERWMATTLRSAGFAPDPERIETVRARLAERGVAEAAFLETLKAAVPDLRLLRPAEAGPSGTHLLNDQAWVALQAICVGF